MKRLSLFALLCSLGWPGVESGWCSRGKYMSLASLGGDGVCRDCPSCPYHASSPHTTCKDSLKGDCFCNTGYKGRLCDSCTSGYRRIRSYCCPNNKYLDSKKNCKICPTGHSIGDKKDGCDGNGNLKCNTGYKGKLCDQCASGYGKGHTRCCPRLKFDSDGQSCRNCACNMKGSNSNTCAPRDGQCPCKPGYKFRDCTGCKDDYYKNYGVYCCYNGKHIKNGRCVDCGCNINGVSGKKCEENGICNCKFPYKGDKCFECVDYYKDTGSNTCGEVPSYNDTDPAVTNVPFIGKCAADQHELLPRHFLKVFKGVASMAACAALCEQYGECIASNFDYSDPSNKNCRLIARQGFEADVRLGLVVNGMKECPRSEGCVHNSRFYSGPNVKAVRSVDSPYTCREICARTDGCEFFTYSFNQATRDPKVCHLKSQIKGDILNGQERSGKVIAKKYVSGTYSCLACYHVNSDLRHIPNLMIDDKVFTTAETYQECQRLCDIDYRCTLFVWHENNKHCYFKNEKTTAVPRTDYAFIMKGCDTTCGKCNPKGVKDPNDLGCDNAGNCKCKDNYKDRECNECDYHHVMAPDGSCNRIGGQSK